MARKTARKSAAKSAAKTRTKRPAKKTARKAKVPPVPKGTHTVSPYLVIANCGDALEFYAEAFGAKELFVLREPSGRVGHAELRIGDSVVMMADENPAMGMHGPKTNPSPVRLHLAVKNVDDFVARAVAAGATIQRPVQDQFYGWRSGAVTDPFGYSWMVSTQVEKVSPKTMQKRWNEILAKGKGEEAA